MPRVQPTHRFEPHRGELRISLRAGSLGELFEEAARALAAAMSGGSASADTQRAVHRVELSAPDREALLVDWLNELIFLAETRRQIFDEVRVESLTDGALTAEIRGRPDDSARTLVKAATFHGLHITESDGELRATVLLDV